MGSHNVTASATASEKPSKSPLEKVKKWEVGQLAAVVHKLDEQNARRLAEDKLRVSFENSVFSTPKNQIEIWKKVLPESLRDQIKFPEYIEQWPAGVHSALVLTLTGPNAASELLVYWDILAKTDHVRWNWNDFNIDQEAFPKWHCNMYRDSCPCGHRANWNLEWQRIDFAANYNAKVPVDLFRQQIGLTQALPGAAVLAALIVHPEWRETYRKGYDSDWSYLYMDIPGYTVFSKEGWCKKGGTIAVESHSDTVRIWGSRSDVIDANWSIPQFVPFDL